MNSQDRRKSRRKFIREYSDLYPKIVEFIQSPYNQKVYKNYDGVLEYRPDYWERRTFGRWRFTKWSAWVFLNSHGFNRLIINEFVNPSYTIEEVEPPL